MTALIANVALVALTAVGCWALGRRIVGSAWPFRHAALCVAAQCAVGLLVLSHVLFALIELGAVTRGALWFLLAVLAALSADEARRWDRDRIAAVAARVRPRNVLEWAFLAAGAAYAAWMTALATLPPLGYDSLVYHLEIPRQTLAQGGRPYLPDNIYAFFPQLAENLFLFGLGLGGEIAAKLFHSVFGALLGLSVYGFARVHVERGWACLAATIFLTVPSVMQSFTWAYVDLTFTLYAFLALIALLRYVEREETVWAVAAGVMAGGAWSTKFTGLQLLLLLGLVLLVGHAAARRRTIPWRAATIVIVAALIFLPYPLRNWNSTGWPLYPLSLGGTTLEQDLNWEPERAELYMQFLNSYGVRSSETKVIDRLTAPVEVFFNARFWSYENYDGVIGPAFLLIPLLLIGSRPSREIKLLGLFTLAYLYFWSVTTLQARFLLPALAPASVLLVYALARSRWRMPAAGLVVILVAVNVGAGFRENVSSAWNGRDRPWGFWSGEESRQEFLARRVTNYAIYEDANRLLGADDTVYLVDMQHLGYYLDCAWRADFVFERWTLTRVLESSSSAADAARRLDARGFTHLMINESVLFAEGSLSGQQGARLRSFLETQTDVLAVRQPAGQLHTLRRIRQPGESAPPQ
jgi:4-amino-4-deoxy-L-arabinose transferase-like glycosyltransferase